MEYLTNIFVGCFSNPIFLVFLIAIVGYLLGSIRIKGVTLGHAGIFLAALLFGHFGLANDSLFHTIGLINADQSAIESTMSLEQSLGLLFFVTSVGFISGPNFFVNLKKNAKSYVLFALVVVGISALTCCIIILCTNIDSSMSVGILSGALTSTPGFAAAQGVVEHDAALLNEVTVGHAIGYPFGVISKVLFVQLIPKILKVDMQEEIKKMGVIEADASKEKGLSKLKKLDALGVAPFALAIVLGVIVGKISFPLPGGASFSLGNTGGPLLVGLVLGHFGRCGNLSMKINADLLKTLRELGLVLFLIGAGVPGGSGFVAMVNQYGFMLFVYALLMTMIPLILGYIFGRKVLKLCVLNCLGSLTGGMTSTPALGALIETAGTDDVAAAYAATYPVALVLIVLSSQFMVTFL